MIRLGGEVVAAPGAPVFGLAAGCLATAVLGPCKTVVSLLRAMQRPDDLSRQTLAKLTVSPCLGHEDLEGHNTELGDATSTGARHDTEACRLRPEQHEPVWFHESRGVLASQVSLPPAALLEAGAAAPTVCITADLALAGQVAAACGRRSNAMCTVLLHTAAGELLQGLIPGRDCAFRTAVQLTTADVSVTSTQRSL